MSWIIDSSTKINYPFSNQINDNFGQSLGLSLNIPIYNRTNNRLGTQQAKIDYKTSELQKENTLLQMQTNIMNALTSVKANLKQHEASQKSRFANEQAYEIAQKQFDIGSIDAFALNTARTNFINSERNEVTAKYNLIFSMKIIDFYRGIPISLD